MSSDPIGDSLPPQWQLLYDELGSQSKAGTIRHAYMMRVGISNTEKDSEWKPLLQTYLGAQPIGEAIWANSLSVTAHGRRGPLSCHFGKYDEADLNSWFDFMDSASRLIRAEPYTSAFQLTEWLPAIYFAAWIWPQSVGYRVESFGFTSDDMPLSIEPFDHEGFRRWETLETQLQVGRYFVLLSHDVRFCSRSAILALHSAHVGDDSAKLVSKKDLDKVVLTVSFKTVQNAAGAGGIPKPAGQKGNENLYRYHEIRPVYLKYYRKSAGYLPEKFSDFQKCLAGKQNG